MNLRRLVELIAAAHNDQDVHVAVGMRRAVGMRAKQDDLVGLKLPGDLPRESADHR